MTLDEKVERRLAAHYQPNEKYEGLLKLMATDPAAFGKLPPNTRLAAGHYLNEKRAWLDSQGKLQEHGKGGFDL